jgi:hypothetical protein
MGIAAQVDDGQINGKFTADFLHADVVDFSFNLWICSNGSTPAGRK